ncbi:CRACD-like protein [Mantella aurantiaca]
MDSKVREGDCLVDDNSAKKKFKFKSFKKFFGLKKRKETLPSLGSGRKQSQSASDVTVPDSGNTDYDSEDDIEATSGVLGSRAVSHDSIFIPEVIQDTALPVRVFSQENVSDHIKALQAKLQSNIKIGPPPFGMLSKRTEDGTSSEDDGLPRSPPEMSLIHETIKTRFSDIHRHHSSLSLGGTGSEEDEQISSETSSRPLSREENTPTDAPRSYFDRRDSATLSPSADFSTPPQFSAFLDNSAARHRLSVKPKNQRSSKARRPSAALQEESFTGLNSMEEEDVAAPSPEKTDSPTEDLTPNKDDSGHNDSPSESSTLLNVEENKNVISKITVGSESQVCFEGVQDPITHLRLQSKNILSTPPVAQGEEMKVPDELLSGSDLKANGITSSKLAAIVKRASMSPLPSSKRHSIKVVRVPGDNNEKPSNTQEITSPVKTTPTSHPEESLQSRRSIFRHSLSERSMNNSEQLLSDKENNNKLGNVDKNTEMSPTEAGSQRKFSVSSAWERPRTNSFNLKGNNEGDAVKNTKLSLAKPGMSKTENMKEEDKISAIAQTENKLTGRKKETLADPDTVPSDKPSSGNITSIQSTVPVASDLSMATDIHALPEDKNPFFKLRPTSLSLRYREGMNPVTTTVKRHSAEFKPEKTESVSLSNDETHEAGHQNLTVSSKAEMKEDVTATAQPKPPLPKKPVLQNITIADNNTNKDMAENESSQEKKSKSPEVKSERKISERRSSLQKIIDKSPPSVVPAESGKGVENKVNQPSWMSMARQKQLSFKDEHPIYKQRTANQEADKQNKERTEVHLKQQADQIQNKTTNTAVAVVPEETKTETNEPRRRANTLPYPVPGTQLSLLTEKEEKVVKRPTLSVSQEPSWMEMAKKKSQAWNDMPQIIK